MPSPWLIPITLILLITTVAAVPSPALSKASTGRLASIDGLRGLLALSVLFHHFAISVQFARTNQWAPPPSHIYNVLGGLGVVSFFMITGFLFFGKIKAVKGHLDLNRFYAARFFRIVPVYLFSVILIYIIVYLQTGLPFQEPLEQSSDSWLLFVGTSINALPQSSIINAGVQWTLLYEWAFYLSIPAVAYAWRRLKLQAWFLFILMVAVIVASRNQPVIPFTNLNTSLLVPFVLGGMAGELGRSPSIRNAGAGLAGTAVMAIALACLFMGFSSAYSLTAYFLIFAAFMPIALGNSVFGLLRTRSMTFLGEISYDVYMLHGIILYVIFHEIAPHALIRAASDWRFLLLILIVSFCVIIFSALVHFFVERPLLDLGRKVVAIDQVQSLAAP